MDPDNPSQPTVEAAYNISGNPVDQNQAERRHAESGDTANSADLVEARERGDVPLPSTHGGGGQPSSLGYGDRGSARDEPDSDMGVANTEAEQMRPFGEGEVAAAQDTKTGFGEQKDLASDLDRKKAEQAAAREDVQQSREENFEVGGALGQEGGPAVVEGR